MAAQVYFADHADERFGRDVRIYKISGFLDYLLQSAQDAVESLLATVGFHFLAHEGKGFFKIVLCYSCLLFIWTSAPKYPIENVADDKAHVCASSEVGSHFRCH